MANRLKGLTIEIKGETVQLTDSLKKVDSTLKDTQTQLKDVNKLLKLDPSNVELLKQKHDLLGTAVKNTKARQDELKKALDATKNAGDTEENRRQQDLLQRELIETTEKLQQLEDEYRKSNPYLEAFSQKAAQVSQSTQKMSQFAAGAGAAMLDMAYNAGTTADDLLTLSRNTGFSVEELQKMKYASDLIDVSMDQMTGSVAKMTKQMASGNDAFETLGVSITDADGNMRNATDVWYESLEALSQVEDGTLRDQLAMELFGKSAMDLSGIVDDGGAALKALGEEAEANNLILSEDSVAAAGEFNDAMDTLKAQAQQAFFSAGAALSESLLPLLGDLIGKVGEVITWFASLDGDTQMLILTVLGLVAAISPVAGLLSGISTIAGVLGTAFTVMTGPIGLVVAAVAALIAIGVALWQNWDTVKAKAGELASAVKEKFEAIRSGIAEKVESAKSTVAGVFESIRSTISDKIEAAKSAVSNAIEAIKGFFNFSWSLPHLSLPHISVTGEFSLMPPSVPHFGISWYDKAMQNGMILNSPTIFGMKDNQFLAGGESGPEVVVGASSLYDMIRSATGQNTGVAPTVNNIELSVTVTGDVRNPDRFTAKLADRLVTLMNRENEVYK